MVAVRCCFVLFAWFVFVSMVPIFSAIISSPLVGLISPSRTMLFGFLSAGSGLICSYG